MWTGSEMIVWGGLGGTVLLNTGGRYNPGTDSWTATSTTNAPSAPSLHTAVWTGSEMIVWGGAGLAAFEHRRQILRRCSESDTHANTFSDPNRDSYSRRRLQLQQPTATPTATQATPTRGSTSDAAAAPDTGTSTLEVRKLKCNYENEQQN